MRIFNHHISHDRKVRATLTVGHVSTVTMLLADAIARGGVLEHLGVLGLSAIVIGSVTNLLWVWEI